MQASKIILFFVLLSFSCGTIAPALATPNNADPTIIALKEVLAEKQATLTELQHRMNEAQPFGINGTILPEAVLVLGSALLIWSVVPFHDDYDEFLKLFADFRQGIMKVTKIVAGGIGGTAVIVSGGFLLVDTNTFLVLQNEVAKKQKDIDDFLSKHPELK